MKPWIKKTLIGFAGATILLGGLSACGHRGGHERGPMSEERVVEMRGKMIERVSDKLELNEAQKLKLGVLADEMIAQRKALRGDSAAPRAEMKALVAGEKFDRARAQTLLTQKTEVVQAGGPKVIAAMADFFDSLNPAPCKVKRRTPFDIVKLGVALDVVENIFDTPIRSEGFHTRNRSSFFAELIRDVKTTANIFVVLKCLKPSVIFCSTLTIRSHCRRSVSFNIVPWQSKTSSFS